MAECEFDSKNKCDPLTTSCVEEEGSYSCDCLPGYETTQLSGRNEGKDDSAEYTCNGTSWGGVDVWWWLWSVTVFVAVLALFT